MPDRDSKGRFVQGNRLASQGGKARAQALSPERRRQIGRMGYDSMVGKYFDGNEHLANEWLAARGCWELDKGLPQMFEEPEPHPAHRRKPCANRD